MPIWRRITGSDQRSDRGRGMERTPYAVFKAGLMEAKKAAKTQPPKEEKKEA